MVETFLNIEHNPSILRIETTSDTQKHKLPPFLKILREVTSEDEYETQTMAQIDYNMPEADVLVISEKLEEDRELRKQSSSLSPNGYKKGGPGQMQRTRTDSRQSNEK